MVRHVVCLALLAACVLAAPSPPEQIHLAYAGASANGYPTGMRVAWYTDDSRDSSVLFRPAGSSASWTQINGTSTSYLEGYGTHHVVLVAGLPAGVYEYQCGDASAWSDIFTFTVPEDSPNQQFSMVVYGDMGWLGSKERPELLPFDGIAKNWTAVPSRATIEQLRATNFSLIWHVGDIAYADDSFTHTPAKFSYEDAYNGYMNWFQNVSANVPYMVSPGNHESECHSPICLIETDKYASKLQNFTAFEHRWHMPATEAGARDQNMWYSFNLGPIHFVSINSETDWPGAPCETKGDSGKLPAGSFGQPGEYLAWLEKDLAQANASRGVRPFIIAGGHRPFEEVAVTHQALFDKYKVDIYFAGHSHSYARRASLPGQTTHLVVGGPGCDEMEYQGHDVDLAAPHMLASYTDPLPPYVYQTAQYAIGVLNVLNNTAVHFQLLNSWTQDVMDQVTLVAIPAQ